MQPSNRRARRQGGQVLVTFTLVMVPLFGIIGLVSDIGYMHFVKMEAQTAAEAAARATIIAVHDGASGGALTCGTNVVCATTATSCPSTITTPANAIQDGCMYAMQHGFTATGNQAVTYEAGVSGAPPTTSGAPTSSYWVTFRVAQQVPQMFSAVLGNTTGLVVARSSAALVGASDCIFALDPHASGAVSAGGTANVTSACGVYVNSDSTTALSENGGGDISAPEYDVVGGYSGSYTPTPNTGVSSISDPLASLPVPATGPYTCDYNNYNANGTVTLNPGVYCGGIHIGNATATMNSGTYILVGGGFSTQSANSSVSGSGILIYNTYDSIHAFTAINIKATSTVALSASNSGTYAGILYFEDRSAPAGYDNFTGGSGSSFQGVLYAKNGNLTLEGNSSAANFTIIVADTISLVGTSQVSDNYSLLPTGSPVTKAIVLE